jgi:hypothetical protein
MEQKYINDFAKNALDSIFMAPISFAQTEEFAGLAKQLEIADCRIALESYLQGLLNCIVTLQPVNNCKEPFVEITFKVNIVDVDVMKRLIVEINKDFNKFTVYWEKSESMLIKKYEYAYNSNSKRN